VRKPGVRISRLLPYTIQGRILLLLLVVMVPIGLLQAGVYYRSFQAQHGAELQSNLEVARSIATTFDAYRQDVLHQELAIGMAFTSAQRVSPEEGQRYLLANAQAYPTVGEFSWISPQGRVLTSSQPEVVGQDVSEQPYYRQVAAGQEWALTDLLIDPVTGQPAFFIVRAFRAADGRLSGLVVASVEPQRLGEVLPTVRIGQGSFTIVDRSGRLVYRAPEITFTWEQRNLADDPMIRRALAGEETAGTFVSGSYRVKRVGAITPIRSVGWVARADRPAAEVEAGVLQSLGGSFALFLLVAVGAFSLAVIVGRAITLPVRRVRDYAASLAAGETAHVPEIRSPREARELALTLGEMAEQLRVREEALRAEVKALDQANLALSESENRYSQSEVFLRGIYEGVQALLFIVNVSRDGDFYYGGVNPAYTRATGLRPEDIVDKRPGEVPGLSREGAHTLRVNCLRCVAANDVIHYEERTALNGEADWWSIQLAPLCDGEGRVYRIIGSSLKITERVRVQEKLQVEVAENQRLIEALGQQVAALDGANVALQRAQRRLLTEREEERKALSRELHGEVIQELLSLKYQVQGLAGDPAHRTDGLTDIHDNICELIDAVRHICSDLRPPTIDSLGLCVAIQSYTYDWSARADVAVHLDLDPQLGRLPEAMELLIFRILQEALSNVRNHAHASAVDVGLRHTSPDTLLVSIADNGCGMRADFDLAALAAAGHYGLLGICERAELMGGCMQLQTQPGGGVLLQVEIPRPKVEGG